MKHRNRRAADAMYALCETMSRLRGPGGCPWDAEQTLDSLRPYLIEEAYEVLEAMEADDTQAHCEELGDLLLQIVFQAEIAQETNLFDLAAVAEGLDRKLKRRHPDLFHADAAPAAQPENAAAALARWENIKATERPKAKGRLSGVPRAMPGLLRALRTAEKAAAAGFDFPDLTATYDKVKEEVGELEAALAQGTSRADIVGEMGDVLFSLVNVCRSLQIDPEAALGQTIDKFHRRFEHVERALQSDGRGFSAVSLDAMNALWEEAKAQEGTPPAR